MHRARVRLGPVIASTLSPTHFSASVRLNARASLPKRCLELCWIICQLSEDTHRGCRACATGQGLQCPSDPASFACPLCHQKYSGHKVSPTTPGVSWLKLRRCCCLCQTQRCNSSGIIQLPHQGTLSNSSCFVSLVEPSCIDIHESCLNAC